MPSNVRLTFTTPSGDIDGHADVACAFAPVVGDQFWYSWEQNGEIVRCWRVSQRMFANLDDSGRLSDVYRLDVVLTPFSF